tara:strand:+ start:1901 stop:2455 length:555 start_codon:yes stop_codon:yes gene_type:complete
MTNRDITLFKCAITRFTDATWEENVEWKRKTQDMEGKFIYNTLSPIPISLGTIPNIFMIEMNISTKQIIGVGLVKNKLCYKHYKVYSENSYNFYTYITKYHMYRDEFSESTRQLIENELEKSIFHGFGHLIRGTGISKLPEPLKYILGRREMRSIVTFETDFMELFLTEFKEKYGKQFWTKVIE